MKLLKKSPKKEERKTQYYSLRLKQYQETHYAPETEFPWKEFFEEAYNMGMKVDLMALSRTFYKIVPPPARVGENAIFGVSLNDIIERQKSKDAESSVPNLVDQCVHYIVKYGLRETGLFKPDSFDFEKIRNTRALIDSGNGVDINLSEHLKEIDVHTAAGLLKQYIRDFPLPVIPSIVFDSMVSSVNATSRGNEEMKRAINQLPKYSYSILERIFYLLVQIHKQTVYNKISISFLADAFGPVLMWRNAIVSLTDMSNIQKIATALINNYSSLFKGTHARPQLGNQNPGISKSATISRGRSFLKRKTTEGTIKIQKEDNTDKGKAPTMRKSMSEGATIVRKGISQLFKKKT